MKYREIYISELAKLVNADYTGNDILINGLGLCNRTSKQESIMAYTCSVAFCKKATENQHVKALVAPIFIIEQAPKNRFSFIISDFPEETFYKIHSILCESDVFYENYNFEPVIGQNCKIHPSAVIEEGVKIGNHVTIGANSVINKGVQIGDNTYVGCCSVIGSEGFQILRNAHGIPYTVKHIGGTIIANNVWIGDNVTICNSLFEGNVVIEENTKIDSHCHISHNCLIGKNTVITPNAILFGSAEICDNVWIAPGALIMNKVKVNAGATIGANSLVASNVKSNRVVMGTPAEAMEDFLKTQIAIKRLLRK